MKLPLWAYLAIGLALSAGINVWQWRADIIEDTEQAAAVKLASEQAKNQVLGDQLKAVGLMAEQKLKDDKEIAGLRQQAAEKQVVTVTKYRDRIAKSKEPKLECHVNQTQATAVNEALK